MRVLMINKFLYPNGGSETYMFKLGDYLASIGYQVEYFGMEHEGRCVGNRVNAYTTDMDFHSGSKLSKLTYSFKTIYSSEARRKIRLVLDDFQPDVCHLNNFNYQLTPSIILEIVKWRKQTGRNCKIVYTAHDYQLVCPNHMLHNPCAHQNCEKCLGGNFINCIKGKCIHGSLVRSLVGSLEAYYWNTQGVYKQIDRIICPSAFVKSKLDTNPLLQGKTVTLHNFVDKNQRIEKAESGAEMNIPGLPPRYVLYFGRYSVEKGIRTLLKVCEELKDIHFVFAGTGPLESELQRYENVTNVGFKRGEELKRLIQRASFCVCPSEWYEVYGLTNTEAMEEGTPVLASNIGGIPEVVENHRTGELFEAGDSGDLARKIRELWDHSDMIDRLKSGCRESRNIHIDEYSVALQKLYEQKFRGGGVTLLAVECKKYCLYFGRYTEEKGVQTLLNVCRKFPDYFFIFAGKGPLEDDIQNTPNAVNVGFVQGETLASLIRNAQLCINPSECYETYGLTNAEALALGTPVVASRMGAFPEIVKDHVNGRLFEAGKAEELTKVLKELLTSREQLSKLAQNASATFFLSCGDYVKALKLYDVM